jgi:5-formyltetrahydrofolate cyclo-ligase
MNTDIKNELRQKYRALRDSFGEEFIQNVSAKACDNLINTKEFQNAGTVLLYYPTKNEISPLPIFELCLKMGKAVAFPVCQTKDSTLIFKTVNTKNSLKRGNFGIFEPDESCKVATIDKDTLCIVPALAFSKDGQRIGYGKGYYDRFLADFDGISVGFSYSMFVCEHLPHGRHDVPLDMIVSESEVLDIAKEN